MLNKEIIADKVIKHAGYLWAIGMTHIDDTVYADSLKTELVEDGINPELVNDAILILMHFDHAITYCPDGKTMICELNHNKNYDMAFKTARAAVIEELNK